jgi:succinate dehydrogenase/fumarate reductase cytochrome b subunit
MATMNILIFKVLEVGLFGVFAYHGLNGIRVIMSDFGMESKYHKGLFWALFAVVIIVVLVGGYPIIRHALH